MPTYLESLPDAYRKLYERIHPPTSNFAARRGVRSQLPQIGVKTNHNVVWHWMNGTPFKSLRMRTDGQELYSYNLCIGGTDPRTDDKIVQDYTAGGIGFYSQTTSQQVNLAKRYADKVCCGD